MVLYCFFNSPWGIQFYITDNAKIVNNVLETIICMMSLVQNGYYHDVSSNYVSFVIE